ncbi:MAG: phytase [candidate division KSB1 bacterium]|nr:phytase [candidate division KSB1 bacterium]MDZ7276141.1 phytase [candidate division KSB1 bacterium]MDZ7287079.1 phytase [candidate division KSB1 bacterium]MDZ7347863.1 phytase [candidate division KSB1 bacterium]MDZ7352168.1 phytase [candidate division KSB1 bacterium]
MALLILAGFAAGKLWRESTIIKVAPVCETTPVPSRGDAADDPAIWINRENPALSTIIATDKDLGIGVYDLSGKELQFRRDGEINNVDLRHGFPLAGRMVDLVTGSNQSGNTLAIYQVNPATRELEEVAAEPVTTCPPYGSCMYRSALTGKFYYFVNSRKGEVEQWELFDNGAGRVAARRVRHFKVGARPEGCVADDELGYFYLAVEKKGIWKFGAEPEAGDDYTVVDRTGWFGHLVPDVEGLALYRTSNSTGYLVASSQGESKYVIYRREGDNEFVAKFQIIAGNGIDAVTHTDGLEVVNFDFGPAFPEGLLVAQDDKNDKGRQNFKLVSWQAIAEDL